MRWQAVLALVKDNLKRNKLFFFASLVGVVTGVASLIVFLSLSNGINKNIVDKLFEDLPETRLKVSTDPLDFGLFNLAKPGFLKGSRLSEKLLRDIRKRKGVEKAYGEMIINFPAKITGTFFGHRVGTDLVGSGVDPQAIEEEFKGKEKFKYSKKGPVPVLVSYKLLELYNSAFAKMNNFPRLTEKTLKGFRFDLVLGKSYLGGKAAQGKIRTVQCELVGFSKSAIAVGITVPLEYTKKWNKEFTGKRSRFQSIYVDMKNPESIEENQKWLEDKGFNVATAKEGSSAAVRNSLLIITAILVGLSVLIMLIAAFNLAFLLFMMVQKRKKEIGLWRTVGATRKEISLMVSLEACITGLIGAVLGIVLGVLLAEIIDLAIVSKAGQVSYALENLVLYPWWIWPVAVFYSVFFALLGSIAPAYFAARLDPIEAMKG